jgi:hypothetical protein
VRGLLPRRSAVDRPPHAAARDADRDALRVARVDADAVDARVVVPAAVPVLALGAGSEAARSPTCAAVLLEEPPGSVRTAGEPVGAVDLKFIIFSVDESGRPNASSVFVPFARGGYFGVVTSSHLPSPPRRWSFVPKWPWSSAA